MTAYDLYLRAFALSFAWERSATIRSLELLEQAIERDPHYGSALTQAAARHFELHVNGWTNDPETSRRKGIELSRQALQAAGDDPNVLSIVAYILGYFGEEIEVAIALLNRGLELNPSSARGWQWSGWLRAWTGQPDLAIKHFETSLRLNPREQRANPLMGIGVPTSSLDGWRKPGRRCWGHCKKSRIGSPPTDFLRPATRIWVVLTRRVKLSSSYAV